MSEEKDNKNNEQPENPQNAAPENNDASTPEQAPAPATAKSLPGGATGNNNARTLPGHTAGVSTGGKSKSVKGKTGLFSLKNIFMAAACVPPALAVMTALTDPAERNVGSLVSNTLSNYAAPITWALKGGQVGPNVQASFVKYCQPTLRITAVSDDVAQRRFADQNYLRGAVSEHLAIPESIVNKVLNSGGYPMIVARFSDVSNPNSVPSFEVRNMDSQQAQNCPPGYSSLNFEVRR